MRPESVTNCRSRLTFLKSSASRVKSIFGFGRGVRRSVERERSRFLSVLVLRGITLLDFPVDGVAAQRRIVLLDFELFRLELLVARGGVARRRLALFPRLGALDRYDFSGHKLFIPSPWLAFLPALR